MELSLDKIVSIDFLRNFRWDVNLVVDEEYCSTIENDSHDWVDILKKTDILVSNVELHNEKVDVTYVIPKTFEGVDSIDLMRTLMLPCYNTIQTILHDEQNNRVFSISSALSTECDWHLSFPSDSYDCLKIVVSYEVAEHSIF